MKKITAILTSCVIAMVLPACQGVGNISIHQQVGSNGIAGSLEQARSAWNVMQRESPRSLTAQLALKRYQGAVANVVKSLHTSEGSAAWGKTITTRGNDPWRITFDAPARGTSVRAFSLAEFSGCQIADEVKLSGFDKVVAHGGIGVPVVLAQEDVHRVAQPFHPPSGEFLPATAVLEFPSVAAGRPAEARLRFYNPLEVSEISVGGNSRSLASNLTAALQFSLTNAIPDDANLRTPTHSASGEVESQLFFLNRYDSRKTPVVFVHGLLCGPDVWKNAVNELLADPDLRSRYQPVCFSYPTGLPIPTTAARLRELLKSSRDKLDPSHRNGGYSKLVLVGHSMGGLVSRMQTIDSGNDFWKAYFTTSPQTVSQHIDAKTRKMLTGSLYFKRQPDVRFVIFIGTPHRGSELADVGFFRAALQLVLFLPKTAKKGLAELADLPLNFMQPNLRKFSDRGVDGTENLSTTHPFFHALASRKIGVPFYSIIATRGKSDIKHGSDGIVPYSSSHLDGAVAEVLVPYQHGCVELPATVEAVTKILKAN